jgi:hypothetical protein
MTNSASSAPALRDIKPAVEILDLPRLIVICLLGLCLAIGCYYFIKWLIRKKVFQTPALSPRERALASLKDAEKLVEQPVEFVILVSAALRSFFEEEYALNAPDRTTEEFLMELSNRTNLEGARPGLIRFLDQTDLVKFAKFEPGPDQLLKLLETAREVIGTETKPQNEGGVA